VQVRTLDVVVGTHNVADDGVVLSMVAQGIGMAILPQLTLTTTPQGVTVAPLGDQPVPRHYSMLVC
jgi:DNA-binding transcriptional LysR family regulator